LYSKQQKVQFREKLSRHRSAEEEGNEEPNQAIKDKRKRKGKKREKEVNMDQVRFANNLNFDFCACIKNKNLPNLPPISCYLNKI